uniref:Uncharacterized protein n=1 Tax=Panagrolaimus davidi TaxID=227884 RepID=A0A914PNL8_9BILA
MAFIGDLSGITERNKTNATYQSMIDGELLYEYAIHRYTTNKTRATFRCAGCRSAISDGRAPPEFKIYYLKGAVDLESKTVIFDEDPDEHPHFYTIVAVFCDYPERQKSFTAGIVFVKEKDTVAYEKLFRKLKDLVGDDFGPKEFGFDHELAAINAAKAAAFSR